MDNANSTVLITGGDPQRRAQLGSTLSEGGVSTVDVPVDAALGSYLEEHGPSLVLVLMDSFGTQVATLIRTVRDAVCRPSLLVIGPGRAEDEGARAFEAGADDVMAGTVHPSELLARVRRLLRLHHAGVAAARRASDALLESLVDASVDGIVAADMRGRIILFNKGAERIHGHRAEDVIGKKTVRELYPPGGAQRVMDLLRSSQYGGEGRLGPMRFNVMNAKGESVPITLSAAMIYRDGQPAATFGIFTDLRERLIVEERLAEAQAKLAVNERQAVLAELAGTTAHELNQPLTSIMGYAELLGRKLPPGSSEREAAGKIVTEAERMADIVRKIGKITKYETKAYVGQQRIIDLDKAMGSQEPQGPPSQKE